MATARLLAVPLAQTAVIEHVIALYFRVLRGFGRMSSRRYHRLLQAVLQNLGKCVPVAPVAPCIAAAPDWRRVGAAAGTHGTCCVMVRSVRPCHHACRVAHVIDVKVALEVMAIFRTMITDGEVAGAGAGAGMPLATVVHVVLAAVAVLQGPGGELLRDEDDGYLVDSMCAALPQLVLPTNQHRDVVAAVIQCTEVRTAVLCHPRAVVAVCIIQLPIACIKCHCAHALACARAHTTLPGPHVAQA